MPTDVIDALHSHPGFALDVALLAAGVGMNSDVGGAELEVLSAHQAALYFVPLDDGILVSTAQRIVAGIGHTMSRDLRYELEAVGCVPVPRGRSYRLVSPTRRGVDRAT